MNYRNAIGAILCFASSAIHPFVGVQQAHIKIINYKSMVMSKVSLLCLGMHVCCTNA